MYNHGKNHELNIQSRTELILRPPYSRSNIILKVLKSIESTKLNMFS